jgi:signal transduction histidine kinase
MDGNPGEDFSRLAGSKQLRIARWLVRAKARTGLKSPHFWLILLLIVAFAFLYYAVLGSFRDVYLVIFCYPLIYAAVVYRLRGVVLGSAAVLAILVPHAVLISSDSYALVTALLFAVFTFLISGLVAALLNYLERQLNDLEHILALNEELNHYIERLEHTQKQLVQAEKLSAIGHLAAAVAHEINNPLAGVLVYSKLLKKKLSGGSLDEGEGVKDLDRIEAAVDHCSYIIKSLLDFARQSEPEFGQVAIPDIINKAMELVVHRAKMSRVQITVGDMSSLPPIVADARQLRQVFLNLMVNAVQAMPEGGELVIRGEADDSGWIKVHVEDNGTGIRPEDMDRLFEPFFTTRKQGEGTGLGLSVSYGIVVRHGGRIEVQSKGAGEGSVFTVCLPRQIKEG